MAESFHAAIVRSKQQPCHLIAISNMALLCAAEAKPAAGRLSPQRRFSYSAVASCNGSFDCLLDFLQNAQQVSASVGCACSLWMHSYLVRQDSCQGPDDTCQMYILKVLGLWAVIHMSALFACTHAVMLIASDM